MYVIIDIVVEDKSSGKNFFINTSFETWKRDLVEHDLRGKKLLYVEDGIEYVTKIFEEDDLSLTFSCYNDENESILKDVKTYMRYKVERPPVNSSDDITESEAFPMIETSFEHELTDIGSFTLSSLEQFLLKSFEPWKTNLDTDLLAPIVSLCQSSGSGKSKISCETLKLHLGFYLVFRGEKQSGYPLKNDLSTELLGLIKSYDDDPTNLESISYSQCTVGKVLNYFARIITRYFKDLLNKSKTKGIESAIKSLGSRFLDNANLKACDCFTDQSLMDILFRKYCNLDADQNITVKNVSTYLHDVCVDPKKAFINQLNDSEANFCRLIAKNLLRFPFLFVIDEAGILSKIEYETKPDRKIRNGFEAFRRAVSYLKANTLTLFLTLSTKSNIVDLNPEVVDESKRHQRRTKVPNPIILSSNLNIFSKEFPVHNFRPTYEALLNPLFLKYLATFGYGIWSSLPFGSLIETGKSKIVNGTATSGDYVQVLWMILTGLASNPLSVETGTLVAKHMGYLLDMSDDLKRLLVMYPADPILAFIAHTCIDELTDDKLFSVLERKFQALDIDRGKTAEIFGGMIILRAIWKSATIQSLDFSQYSYSQYLDHIKAEAPEFNDLWERDTHNLEKLNERRKIQAKIDALKRKAGVFNLKPAQFEEFKRNASSLDDEKMAAITEIDGLQSELDNIPPNHNLGAFSYYKVHTVGSFLTKLLNLESSGTSSIGNFGLPEMILEGLVTGNQLVNLDSFSGSLQYSGAIFSPQRPSVADNRILDKSRFILTEDLLRICLIQRLVIKFPPGYYGFDYAIPVLLKSGEYTFIGVQIKRACANLSEDVYKMKAKHHFVKCPLNNCPGENCNKCTKNETLQKIYSNQISILLSLDEPEMFPDFTETIKTFKGCTKQIEKSLEKIIFTGTDSGVGSIKKRSPSFFKPLMTIRECIKNDILLCKSLWMDKLVTVKPADMPQNVDFYDDGFLHRQFCIVVRGWANYINLFSGFESSQKIAHKLMNPEGLLRHFPNEHRSDPKFIRKIISDLSVSFPFYSEELRCARGEESYLDKLNSEVQKSWIPTQIIKEINISNGLTFKSDDLIQNEPIEEVEEEAKYEKELEKVEEDTGAGVAGPVKRRKMNY